MAEDREAGRVFISYRRQETAWPARQLYELLVTEFGADRIFKDVDNIEPGAVTIFPDEAKLRYDIVIPQLTRALARSDSPLNQLHPADIPDPKNHLAVPDVQPQSSVGSSPTVYGNSEAP